MAQCFVELITDTKPLIKEDQRILSKVNIFKNHM